MNRKKILHIPNYYPPHIGGIEDVCHTIVLAMENYRHEVICFHNEKKTQKDFYEGIQVIRCGVFKKVFSQSVSLSFFKELKNVFKNFDPDIVHFHTPNPLVSVYLLMLLPKKTKLIVHWHSDIIEQNLLYLFYRPIEKQLLSRADKIVATSPVYAAGSEPLSDWPNKMSIIPNTIYAEKLQKQAGDEEAIEKVKKLYGEKKIIFTFGRHVSYKGLHHLIDIAPLLEEEAVIVIAGQGPLSETLKKRSNHPSLYFLGRLSDNELRHYLYASDVFAFPSVTRNEAFGIAMAEAMYCGLPVATFTIPYSGVNWVCIHGETGLESENGNTQAFAAAVNQLLSDPILRKKLGTNASQRAKNFFATETIKDKLIDLYN
jgi:glycosyltransferase involved in cell wall biosynthesis